MALSLLARTMSMFDSMVVKNGQSLYMAWSVPMPSSGCALTQFLTAVPNPYQPGNITRHCDQLKTQGIARRSSMRAELRARGRPAANVEIGNLANDGCFAKVAVEVFHFIHQATVFAVGMCRKFIHCREVFSSWVGTARVQQRRFQRRRGESFQIASADLGIGILGGNHFSLFGDADRALHGARGLSKDRLVARSTAATHRATATMKEAQSDIVTPKRLDQSELGPVELPG